MAEIRKAGVRLWGLVSGMGLSEIISFRLWLRLKMARKMLVGRWPPPMLLATAENDSGSTEKETIGHLRRVCEDFGKLLVKLS